MFPSGGAQTRPELLFAGRYVVDGALPWGGLVTYYRGAAEGTPVILGVVPMDVSRTPKAAATFADFARRLGQVKSRGIPRILDAGAIDGIPYLAFEDTRGHVLTDLLRDRALSSVEILRLGAEILDALEAVHARGLVHGDLTPHNVVVSRDGRGRLHAHLLGVGVLDLLRSNPEASAHSAATGSGTFAISYMAPELFGGRPQPGSDIYSAGMLLHHMVLGSVPVGWEGSEGFEDLPGLRDVVAHARSQRLDDRYASASVMRAALDWVEVESSKLNPHTQDIAPWMETSYVGSIPVPALASSYPPHNSSPHARGTILTGRPIPLSTGPVAAPPKRVDPARRWLPLGLLLLLLGALVLLGSWHNAQLGDTAESIPEARPMEGGSGD